MSGSLPGPAPLNAPPTSLPGRAPPTNGNGCGLRDAEDHVVARWLILGDIGRRSDFGTECRYRSRTEVSEEAYAVGDGPPHHVEDLGCPFHHFLARHIRTSAVDDSPVELLGSEMAE